MMVYSVRTVHLGCTLGLDKKGDVAPPSSGTWY